MGLTECYLYIYACTDRWIYAGGFCKYTSKAHRIFEESPLWTLCDWKRLERDSGWYDSILSVDFSLSVFDWCASTILSLNVGWICFVISTYVLVRSLKHVTVATVFVDKCLRYMYNLRLMMNFWWLCTSPKNDLSPLKEKTSLWETWFNNILLLTYIANKMFECSVLAFWASGFVVLVWIGHLLFFWYSSTFLL